MFEVTRESSKFKGDALEINELTVVHNQSHVFSKEVVRTDALSVVIPFRDEYVLIIGQYRPTINRFCYELPLGIISPGESPMEAARRGLKEDAGFEASCWSFVSSCYSSLSWTDEKTHFYVATELYDVEYPPPNHEETEKVFEWFPFCEAVRYAKSGQFYGAATNLGLLMAAEHMDEIVC